MTDKHFIFGFHAVQSVLQKNPIRIARLLIVDATKNQTLADAASHHHIPVEWVKRDKLDQLTHSANHQGVVAFCEKSRAYSEADIESIVHQHKKPLLLVLDGVQDPHNLGACLRTADAAGVDAVIAPKDKAVGLTPVVSKVASGAAETVPFIQVTNLARTLGALKEMNIWVVGAAATAEQSLFEADLKVACACVMGAEGKGLRRLTQECCDFLVNIPMYGTVSSLNVSVATGVFLFEVVRQRQLKK